jgi:hypothetical protein
LLANLFDDPNAFDLSAVTKLCTDLKIGALVIKDKDGILSRQPVWLNSLPVLAVNAHARIVKAPGDRRAPTSNALDLYRSPAAGAATKLAKEPQR